MSAHPELVDELKRLIIDALLLEDISPEKIGTNDPLFGEGLGLDSIDALEIALALEQKYGITVDEDAEDNQARFASVASLADFFAGQLGRTS
jgi:acyl carrier protein